jgi:hypothetical protein
MSRKKEGMEDGVVIQGIGLKNDLSEAGEDGSGV